MGLTNSFGCSQSLCEGPNLSLSTSELPACNQEQFRQTTFDVRVHSLIICCFSMPKPRQLIILASGASGSLIVKIMQRGNQSDINCQLDITCFSPFVLAVPNGVWAVIAAYKLPEQLPTLLLKQLTQIYEYIHISRLLYAYCTPVIATVNYKPGLALNPIFISFHYDKLAIIMTYYCYLASN
jgi:hypothetical protein